MNPRLNIFKNKKLTLSLSALLLLFAVFSLIPAFKNPILSVLKNPISIITLVRREVAGIIFYHRNFIQNERLKKEMDLLKQKLNAQEEVSLENARLNNLLSLKQKSPYKMIAAKVIGRSPDNWSSVIIIDKGRSSGIKPGLVVIDYLGLVGRVIEVSPSTSKIILLKDTNFSVSGVVQRSRQEGLVSGTLGAFLIMKYLPKDSDIEISDTIITSGLTEVYPAGLLIGTVVEIGEEFSGIMRYAVVKPSVNLSNLEEVLIIMQ